MAYALQSMLKIRGMREDRAQTELAGARVARVAAEKVYDQKREEHEEFAKTKEERRDRLFDTVMGRPVKMEELDSVRSAVTRIDEEDMLLLEAEHKAKDELEAKDKEVETARVRFVAASKNLMKIQEHRKVWAEQDKKEQEYKEDSEMEEFTGRKMISDDDDSLD